ncbi:molybdopterin-dependent oxidoreductase [Candidatus Uabimicrobium amorphum]|uniref:Nitrate reductase n=1 Tax=Uabimicrobium amorphum TaxID=2596890 RepID=A0A5S9F4G3_UABAM|nr:molybdopterin-dependent oxidoreductase [Candidatus Uabimicrobium amorphum]BBM85775.1 nitrate reductase [Candidatus Uabimicrobium amorphum]
MDEKQLKVVGDSGAGHNSNLLKATLEWKVKIGGSVRYPQILDLAKLWSLPTCEVPIAIECVSAGKIYGKKPAIFMGVSLQEIIALVNPESQVQTVIFTSYAPGSCGPETEKHCTALDYEYCRTAQDVIVSGCLNGKPLPYKNGGPLRLVAGAERYFYKSLKWLREIEFSIKSLDECLGTWEKYAGYHNVARIEHKERFSPFLCEILDVDENGNVSSLQKIATEEQSAFIEDAHQRKNFSHIVAAKVKWEQKDFNSGVFCEKNRCAQLRGINFARASFLNADMRKANFSLSIFREAKFSEGGKEVANLDYCDCEGASFLKAHLENVSMKKAYLLNTRFYPEGENKKYSAYVRGLDLTGSIGIDRKQLDWLREDGAIVDDIVTLKTIEDEQGYLPVVQVEVVHDGNDAIYDQLQASKLFHNTWRSTCKINAWGYIHKKNEINKLLCKLSVVYNDVLFTVSPNPVWLLSTMRSQDG